MRYPGASWAPINRNYTARPRHATRGVILHVAASEASSLRGWFNNPAAQASSHLYVRRDGSAEQYVPMDASAWTSGSASYTTIGVETQGGATGPWTPEQMEALARICAWAHTTYGVPLQAMASSKANQRGIGWHRLGVAATTDQLRRGISQTGGPLWSKSAGKVCPGDQRIRQIPTIIARAKQLAGDNTAPTPGRDWFDMADLADLEKALRNVLRSDGISISGATKAALGVDQVPLTSLARYAAAGLFEGRNQHAATEARLIALQAAVTELAKGVGLDPTQVAAAIDTAVKAALADLKIILTTEA